MNSDLTEYWALGRAIYTSRSSGLSQCLPTTCHLVDKVFLGPSEPGVQWRSVLAAPSNQYRLDRRHWPASTTTSAQSPAHNVSHCGSVLLFVSGIGANFWGYFWQVIFDIYTSKCAYKPRSAISARSDFLNLTLGKQKRKFRTGPKFKAFKIFLEIWIFLKKCWPLSLSDRR